MIDVKSLFRRGRILPVLVASTLGASVVATGAASAATAPVTPAPASVRADFFGMHHSTVGSDRVFGWPAAGTTGTIRLWDSGTTWRDIETTRGVYNFSRLDDAVSRARSKRARVLLVLGMTPNISSYWTSRVPSGGEYHGTGSTTMPPKAAWQSYIRALAKRYGTSIEYQVWNEGNVPGFWSAGPGNLAKLTRWAREALNSVRATSRGRGKLIAPAFGTRSGISYIGKFYAQKPPGPTASSRRYPVVQFVDAVSLQLYPFASAGPEGSMVLLASAKRYLAKYKVNKPIYNTEINYGFQTGAAARRAVPITAQKQAAFASRTLVLNASNRISRVYWYRWDMRHNDQLGGTQGNALMVESNGFTPSAAGKAWRVTRTWLEKSRPRGCTKDRRGTYTCTFKFPKGTALKRVVWNPTRNVTVRAPRYTNAYYKIDNVKRAAKAGTKIRVGMVPVMIRSSR